MNRSLQTTIQFVYHQCIMITRTRRSPAPIVVTIRIKTKRDEEEIKKKKTKNKNKLVTMGTTTSKTSNEGRRTTKNNKSNKGRKTSKITTHPNKKGRKTTKNNHVSTDVRKQTGRTCYAHAVATGLREALIRSEEAKRRFKQNAVPGHHLLYGYCEEKFGSNGSGIKEVLKFACNDHDLPTGCLSYKQVTLEKAVKMAPDRAIIAGFFLTTKQWQDFTTFFRGAPNGKFEVNRKSQGEKKDGHAVAIVGIGSDKGGRDYFHIKNSWGEEFADAGYFRVYCNGFKFHEFWLLE